MPYNQAKYLNPVIHKVSLFFSEDYLCCNYFEDGTYHTDDRVAGE